MPLIKNLELKNIKENIYFLDCLNINICMSNNFWVEIYNDCNEEEENLLYGYDKNINDLLKFIYKNINITKRNYYKQNENYLVINTKNKISLTDYLLNAIFTYIYYYRTVLEKKFYKIIEKNIIYKKECNPILNPVINEEYLKNQKLNDFFENEIYFNKNLFYDLSKLNLKIKIKFNIINSLDDIISVHNINNDIFYKLDEGDFITKDNKYYLIKKEKTKIKNNSLYNLIIEEELCIVY